MPCPLTPSSSRLFISLFVFSRLAHPANPLVFSLPTHSSFVPPLLPSSYPHPPSQASRIPHRVFKKIPPACRLSGAAHAMVQRIYIQGSEKGQILRVAKEFGWGGAKHVTIVRENPLPNGMTPGGRRQLSPPCLPRSPPHYLSSTPPFQNPKSKPKPTAPIRSHYFLHLSHLPSPSVLPTLSPHLPPLHFSFARTKYQYRPCTKPPLHLHPSDFSRRRADLGRVSDAIFLLCR